MTTTEFWHTFWFGFTVGAALVAALIAAVFYVLDLLEQRRRQRDYQEIENYEHWRERMSR